MNFCVPTILFCHRKCLPSIPSFQAKFLISYTKPSLIDLNTFLVVFQDFITEHS